jgi:NADPH-dependent glutamate synthase beta subunit-like oxidoreductase
MTKQKTADIRIVPEEKVSRRSKVFGAREEFKWVESHCTACGRCSRVCPVDAINIDRTKELTKRMRSAPCSQACPAGLDGSRYARFIGEGRYGEAAAVIRERAPFPLVLGHVCKRPCEAECQRGQYEGTLQLRALKRFAAVKDDGEWRKRLKIAPDTGKKVAVVGSGPAGMSIAWFLRTLGHQVTVFEALPDKGGKMMSSIPDYQLPKDVVAGEIEIIESLGVEVRTNTSVESTQSLLADGYDAVALAIGVKGWGKSIKLPIPGTGDAGVVSGAEMMKKIEAACPLELGQKVIVLGGGAQAFRIALTAAREGATDVHIFGQEHTGGADPDAWEVDSALAEGVVVHSSSMFYRVIREDGQVRGVSACKIRALGYDSNGQACFDALPGDEEIYEADSVVSTFDEKDFESEPMGVRPSVFAAGDAVNEQRSVIESIAAARWVAAAVDRYLGGAGDLTMELAGPESAAALTPIKDVKTKFPSPVPVRYVKAGDGSQAASEQTLPDTAAVADARRCLKCDLSYELKDYQLDTGVCVFCGRCVEACYWKAITPGAGYEKARQAAEVVEARDKRFSTILTVLVSIGVLLIAAVTFSKLADILA